MTPARPSTSRYALAAAGFAAIGASVCCVVPLVFVLLGIGGAWMARLTAFDVWRPWFTAATIVCLLAAFWALYRPAVQCATGGACADPRRLRAQRRWLWIATGAIALLLLFPYYIGWFL